MAGKSRSRRYEGSVACQFRPLPRHAYAVTNALDQDQTLVVEASVANHLQYKCGNGEFVFPEAEETKKSGPFAVNNVECVRCHTMFNFLPRKETKSEVENRSGIN
jgi:hypothetical protein